METRGVSSAILTAIHNDVANQLASIAKRPFDGSEIQDIEKEFFENIGRSGARGLAELFARNDEANTTIIYDGQKHYRKHLAIGRYLTLLGEISLKCRLPLKIDPVYRLKLTHPWPKNNKASAIAST